VLRIKRLKLDNGTQSYLHRKQAEANQMHGAGTLDTSKLWKSARQTKTLSKALKVLQQMMGQRQRCMYCLDSHGSDIEHFRPKAVYPKRMFNWRNLLLCCSECGRIKGDRFPLQGNKPLLIDPTKEQPWQYIDFDPMTGNLVARFDPITNEYSIKGESTVITLQLDQREALAAGYKQTFTRLSKVVQTFLNAPHHNAQQLIAELRSQDDHGLLGWVFIGTGNNVEPFRQLQQLHIAMWTACNSALRKLEISG